MLSGRKIARMLLEMDKEYHHPEDIQPRKALIQEVVQMIS